MIPRLLDDYSNITLQRLVIKEPGRDRQSKLHTALAFPFSCSSSRLRCERQLHGLNALRSKPTFGQQESFVLFAASSFAHAFLACLPKCPWYCLPIPYFC